VRGEYNIEGGVSIRDREGFSKIEREGLSIRERKWVSIRQSIRQREG